MVDHRLSINLRRVLLELALTVWAGAACAQGCPSPTDPPAPPGSPAFVECERKGQALFAEYQAKYRGTGAQGAEALLRVQAHGRLAETRENTNALRALLASRVTTPEKVALVRLLARQHAPANPTGMNHLIVSDLRQLTTASDDELARAAVFAFSRSGFHPDSEAVLLAARSRRVLDEDGYYGELAHLVMRAAGEDQARLLRTLRAGRNRYSVDILLMGFAGSAAPQFGPAARAELLPLVETMEPKFGITVSLYDAIDGFRYADWLLALAELKHPGSPRDAAEFVMATIDQPLIDPRKIIAVLTAPHAATFMRTIGDRSRFDRMLEIVDRYPRQFPGNNAALREAAATTRDAVARNTR